MFISLLAKGPNQLSWVSRWTQGWSSTHWASTILPASVIIPSEHQPWLQPHWTPPQDLLLSPALNTRALRVVKWSICPGRLVSMWQRQGAHLYSLISEFLWLPRYSLVWSHRCGRSKRRTTLQGRKFDAQIQWLVKNHNMTSNGCQNHWWKLSWEREYFYDLKPHPTDYLLNRRNK